MIDTHAHLDDRVFANDLHGVLERAAAAGVENIVTVGTDLQSSRAAIALAENHRHIWASVGVHPHDASKLYPADVEELRDLARHPRVAAGWGGASTPRAPGRDSAGATRCLGRHPRRTSSSRRSPRPRRSAHT